MKILKAKEFSNQAGLTTFVQDNGIDREDIFTIIASGYNTTHYTIFFYADPDVKEKERNMWGNLKD